MAQTNDSESNVEELKNAREEDLPVNRDTLNHKTDNRVQVAFRMERADYIELKRMALDRDTTVNDLLVRAVKELRARR